MINVCTRSCEMLENCLQWRNDILHLKFQLYSWECKNKYKSKSIPYLLKESSVRSVLERSCVAIKTGTDPRCSYVDDGSILN